MVQVAPQLMPEGTEVTTPVPTLLTVSANRPEPTGSASVAVSLEFSRSLTPAGAVTVAQALTPDELAIAERVHTGRIACELGAHVNVSKHEQHAGHFQIDGKGFKYEMVPVATTTGTVRLEDKAAGAVWLQIANKSMLMNQKLGQRLADECMSPEQFQVAEAIKKNPPPSVLDPVSGNK